jgi:hypothetical protein
MNAGKVAALRLVLLLVAVSNIMIGIAANLGPDLAPAFLRVVAASYGVTDLTLSPQLAYILKPLGAYMIAVGALAFVASRDPLQHRVLVYGIAGLLGLRVLQRLIFGAEAQAAFGISTGRMVGQSLFFVAIALTLVALLPRSTHRV